MVLLVLMLKCLLNILNDQVSFGIEMFAEDVTTPENLNVQQSGSGENGVDLITE